MSATLPSLLWIVLRSFERAYIAEGAGGDMPSLDLWANLVRGLDDVGINVRELPVALRLSKRAVHVRLSAAIKREFVEQSKPRRGETIVRLTERGAVTAARWPPLQTEAERRWRAEVGARSADALRAELESVVEHFPLEHPHYPASYGAADASITGGNGCDWRPVQRTDLSLVAGLPLSALLSQAIVDYAMVYETQSPVALSLTAAVIEHIPPTGRPLRELGNAVGVSALARHGFLRMTGSNGREIVHLTPRGSHAREAHVKNLCAVERRWRTVCGSKRVDALRTALADVANA